MCTVGIRLLLIEDHDVTLSGLQSAFGKDEDIDVIGQARTAKEGVRLARELEPEIVLLDLHLPDSQGPTRLVSSFIELGKPKVVIFSGDDRRVIREAVVALGIAGYLLKSETMSNVVQMIKDIAAGRTNSSKQELDDSQIHITTAEGQLLRFLARGKKYQEIAEQRVVSPLTVRKQTELLIQKLGLQTREELIAWAVERGYGKLELLDP